MLAYTKVTVLGSYDPPNNTATLAYFEPTGSSNESSILETTMHRIWPVFILEEKTNGPFTGSTGTFGCVQALNFTNSGTSGIGGSASGTSPASTSSSGTTKSVSTGLQTGSTSSTAATSNAWRKSADWFPLAGVLSLSVLFREWLM